MEQQIPTPDPYFWYALSSMLGLALLAVLWYFLNRLIGIIDRHDREIIDIKMDIVQIKAKQDNE
jgi:hypothetical protein